MGQYYLAVNVTRGEYISHDLSGDWSIKHGWWLHARHPILAIMHIRWSATDDVRFVGDEGTVEQYTGEPGPEVTYGQVEERYACVDRIDFHVSLAKLRGTPEDQLATARTLWQQYRAGDPSADVLDGLCAILGDR